MMKKWFLLGALLLPAFLCWGQNDPYVTTPQDRALAESILTDLQKQRLKEWANFLEIYKNSFPEKARR